MNINFTPAIAQNKNVNFKQYNVSTEASFLRSIKKNSYTLDMKARTLDYYNINENYKAEPELAILIRKDYAVAADYLLRTDPNSRDYLWHLNIFDKNHFNQICRSPEMRRVLFRHGITGENYFVNRKNPLRSDSPAANRVYKPMFVTSDVYSEENKIYINLAEDERMLAYIMFDPDANLFAPGANGDVILNIIMRGYVKTLSALLSDPEICEDIKNMKYGGGTLLDFAASPIIEKLLRSKGFKEYDELMETNMPQIPNNVDYPIKHYYINRQNPQDKYGVFESEARRMVDAALTDIARKYKGKEYYPQAPNPSDPLLSDPISDEYLQTVIFSNPNFDILEPQEDGVPLLFHIVKEGHINTIAKILEEPKVCKDLINLKINGQTMLDYAKSPTIAKLLISKGAKGSSGVHGKPESGAADWEKAAQVTDPIKPGNTELEDARVVAAQVFLEEPVKVTPAQVLPKAQPADTPQENELKKEINFFEKLKGLKDVPEEQEGAKLEETTEKTKKELPKSFANYNVLKITDSDPKTFDEIIGMNKIKNDLKENVIIPLKTQSANETLKANDIDIPNGVLVQSQQDMINLVKALSNETDMPVLELLNPEELKPMLNDIEKEYKTSGQKTIILIRNFDKFFTTGPNCDMEKKNFILAVENCKDKGALLFATTDDKSAIDSKFLNLRIFDKVMDLKLPDFAERKETLTQYFDTKPLFEDLNKEELITELAEKTEGFNYPAMEKVLEEGARRTVAQGKAKVEAETLRSMISEYTEQAGIVPVDDFNKTAMYDTPEFKRIPVEEGEMMSLYELGGMPEIKERLRDLYVRPLKNLDKLQKEIGNAAIPDGAIFYGPAGNGKTLTAKVLARELGLPFYETKLSDIGTSYVHEEPKAIKKLAQQLNDKFKATGERSVWFLDEFDSMGSERNGSDQHNKELTDALLQEFTNPASRGFILIAATNDLANVDSALKRRGRLGNWIAFSNPDFDARADVIKKTLASTPFTKEFSNNDELINKIAKDLDGLSMSSITSIISDAKRLALLNNIDFSSALNSSIDAHMQREMGEFCNKAGLKAHKYNDWDFKSLDELGGMEEVKKQLEENIIDVWRPEVRAALIANKRSLPGGVILEGPPGGGKTTIVETLARQMNVPLYKMNYSQSGNEYIHGVARNVTEIFNKLALESKILKKPVILFFDEAEKFFPRYANGHQVEEVNTYKELMNTAAASGIILMAATNHIDMVNQEIIGNPRRMGTVIHVGNPNENDRTTLISKLFDGLPILAAPLSAGLIAKLAKNTEGMSIGQISDAVDKIITQAVKKKQTIQPEALLKLLKK